MGKGKGEGGLMAEHTPIPWRVGFADGSGSTTVTTVGEHDYSHPAFAKIDDLPGRVTLKVDHSAPRRHYFSVACICEMSDDSAISEVQQKANAAFIVRAVNCHEELVKAVKRIDEIAGFRGIKDIDDICLAALAKVKEPTAHEARLQQQDLDEETL